MKLYFDVVVDSNSYYIIELPSKPKAHDSALATLTKIESIVKNKLTYNSRHSDCYSTKSRDELLEILKKKSSQIHNGYLEKHSKLIWIILKIFSKEKKIAATHKRIENYIDTYIIPPQIFSLSNELIQEIGKHLSISDLGTLAQLNFHGKSHSTTALIKRAKEFGSEAHSITEASAYLKLLLEEVVNLVKEGIIPKKYLSKKGKKIYPGRILHNLQGMSTENIFPILSEEKFNSMSYIKLRNVFCENGNWKATNIHHHLENKKKKNTIQIGIEKK